MEACCHNMLENRQQDDHLCCTSTLNLLFQHLELLSIGRLFHQACLDHLFCKVPLYIYSYNALMWKHLTAWFTRYTRFCHGDVTAVSFMTKVFQQNQKNKNLNIIHDAAMFPSMGTIHFTVTFDFLKYNGSFQDTWYSSHSDWVTEPAAFIGRQRTRCVVLMIGRLALFKENEAATFSSNIQLKLFRVEDVTVTQNVQIHGQGHCALR